VTKRIVFAFAALALVGMTGAAYARVEGLPDFTGLVEESVPAVVNIRVTQFGDRVRPDREMENPHSIFRAILDTANPTGRGRAPDSSSRKMATS
jgi:hypothetical protein